MWSCKLQALAGLGLLALAAPLCAQTAPFDYPVRPDRVLLLSIADSGGHLAAVGERGVVLVADPQAKAWTTVRTPTTRTLSGIAFSNPQVGTAVGHGGTLLRTTDGGQHWQALDVDSDGDALLGVAALGDGRMAAWGAFGLYLLSRDDGVTWQRLPVIDSDFDRHIAQVIRLADRSWLMVGESGTLARSSDLGETWQALASPYAGSLFGALQAHSGELLVFGMRGNLWVSHDQGLNWQQRDTGTTRALNTAVELHDGRLLVLGNGGLARLSDDQGDHFEPLDQGRASLAKAVQLADGRVLAAGDQGVTALQMTGARP